MDEKIKTSTLRFPAKENPNMEKASFDWSIVWQYDVQGHTKVALTASKVHVTLQMRNELSQI